MKWQQSLVYVALATLMAGSAYGESVELKPEGGTYVVPVVINNKITLDFTLDSGAADVSIPLDVFSTLRRTKTISKADILGTGLYTLADGSEQRQTRFKIRSLKIGQLELHNVTGSVAPPQGSLLLGQSFLSRLQTWSVSNRTHVLYLNELPNGERIPTSQSQQETEHAPEQVAQASPTTQTDGDRVYCEYMRKQQGFSPASCASPTTQTEADRVYCEYMRKQQGFSPARCAWP